MTLQPFVYNCQVVKVVDGDTLELMVDLGFALYKSERLRLDCIDTAESFGATKTEAGKASKAFTESWAAATRQFRVQVRKYNRREKYGRMLGDLYRFLADGSLDPVSLGQALVAAGMAKPTTIGS
jgi:micrococcal nuclease